MISALDWHPVSNLLLSCSVDRGIIVWENDGKNNFAPQMGVVKEKMANLDASWNMRGDKYCVGSSSGHVYVGKYYADNNFWVAHSVKGKPIHKASVVCVRFDPLSSRAVVSASLDGSVMITSAFYEDVDSISTEGPFGSVSTFGENLHSISSNTWINGLAFSPNSKILSYVTHDCEINFVDVTECGTESKNKPKSEKVLHKGNPHMNCLFIDDQTLIASGFDKIPYIYKLNGAEWK